MNTCSKLSAKVAFREGFPAVEVLEGSVAGIGVFPIVA